MRNISDIRFRDKEDLAEYMTELKFGADWFDGEWFTSEEAEAYYNAVMQYIGFTLKELKLRKDETPLYEGNLNELEMHFIVLALYRMSKEILLPI